MTDTKPPCGHDRAVGGNVPHRRKEIACGAIRHLIGKQDGIDGAALLRSRMLPGFVFAKARIGFLIADPLGLGHAIDAFAVGNFDQSCRIGESYKIVVARRFARLLEKSNNFSIAGAVRIFRGEP